MAASKITLKDIANKAGVSIASVSRVIRNPKMTSWTTQKRVHHAMTLLNWNGVEKLKPYNCDAPSKKILVVDNQLVPNSLINFGLENNLKKLGYKIVYFRILNCSEDEIIQLISFISNHCFDGILMINHAPFLNNIKKYAYALPPIVLINQFSLNFPCVYFDHLLISYQITEYYLNNGHKNIAVLLNNDKSKSSEYLIQGYRQALLRKNIIADADYIIPNCFSYQHGQLAVKTLMQRKNPPTAIIITDSLCLNYTDQNYLSSENHHSTYQVVLGAIHQCAEMKINIPHQLRLFYFSHDIQKQYNQLDNLNIANKPLQEMGEKSVNLLIKLIEKGTASLQIANPIEIKMIYRDITHE